MLTAFAALCLTVPCSQGAVILQELFDGITSSDASIDGKGDGTTSIGMTGSWATNGSTGIYTANNFNVDGSTLPGLPSNNGSPGGVWRNVTSWSTNIYATRQLATAISFGTTQEIFFSVRLNNAGDTAMGVGLASGASGSASMVGAGFSWNNATMIGGSGNDSGNAAYICHGTLDTNNGVYGISAREAAGRVDGFGLLVGRITINATGNDVLDIKRYAANDTIDSDLSTMAWGATSSFDSSMDATHLALWVNGSGTGQLDAIRFGATWQDATGVNAVPEPSAALLGGLGLLAMLRRRR